MPASIDILVDIPGPKFYSTDGKNKLIHTTLYGRFKTKTALHAAAFRTPWCKICAIFPAVQTKMKKTELQALHNTESFGEVRAESMISGCQPSTSATTQHISDFKTTYNLFLINLHRSSFWGERYERSRFYQSTRYPRQLNDTRALEGAQPLRAWFCQLPDAKRNARDRRFHQEGWPSEETLLRVFAG